MLLAGGYPFELDMQLIAFNAITVGPAQQD